MRLLPNSVGASVAGRLLLGLPVIFLGSSAPAIGQVADEIPPAMMAELPAMTDDMADDGVAMEMVTEIVVTGTRIRPRFNTPVSGSTLAGDALVTSLRATLGDTLAHQPGVSSTSFGPGASRPVLRGFTGDRTRLLIDGIGSLDVSNTSPDHAVAINPLVVDRIEVLRGASSLLYASGAVGGIVNTVGNRIPRKLPDVPVTGLVSGGFGSAADEFTTGAKLDFAVGEMFAVHFDGQFLDAGDTSIGGFVLAPNVRRDALASPDAGTRALASLRGRLPNTDARTYELAGGAALITDTGQLGVSLSWFNSAYGLPTRLSLDPATPQPDSRIDLGQFRVDVRGSLSPGGDFIDELRLRFGFADYAHDELLTTGARTARFQNLAYEGRVEAALVERGPVRATFGGQWQFRDFRVDAAAPLLPPTETSQLAGFSHYEVDLAPLRIEAGLRFENTRVSADADPAVGNRADRRTFNSFSASLGGNYRVSSHLSLGLNTQYAQRAPVVEELYTQGTDPGTQGVLLGNPDLDKERSWGVEGVARGYAGAFSVEASAYFYRFSNFIFAGETGVITAGLPVFRFQSTAADYAGFEIQAKADVARAGDWKFGADALADYTVATLRGGAPAPRIPPLRVLGGVTARTDRHDARIEVEWVARQSRTTAFESPTRGYVLANFIATTRPLGDDSPLLVTFSANNIFAAEARRHASFLKDYAPIAGRDFRIGARLAF